MDQEHNQTDRERVHRPVDGHKSDRLGRVELIYVDTIFFFFQAEDGIRDLTVTGVQTCALPISVGSVTLNQQLSEDRANEVVNILIQDGQIPLTRMLAPGAMGESQQTGKDTTAEGQAENRRVVVRVLQNKAIAGV